MEGSSETWAQGGLTKSYQESTHMKHLEYSFVFPPHRPSSNTLPRPRRDIATMLSRAHDTPKRNRQSVSTCEAHPMRGIIAPVRSARISELDAARLESCRRAVPVGRRLMRRRVLDDETEADDRAARRQNVRWSHLSGPVSLFIHASHSDASRLEPPALLFGGFIV
eukprot:4135457-Prymnesium_polylepis.2